MMTVTLADRATSGYALPHNEGEAFWLLGMLQTVKIGRADTGGAYGMLEIVVPPGLGSPWHVHPEEDEWFYVLDGNLTFYVGDTRLDLTAGGFAFGPKNVPHTFIGAGPEPARAKIQDPSFLLSGMRTDRHGRFDSVQSDTVLQFLHTLRVEFLARLSWIFLNVLDWNLKRAPQDFSRHNPFFDDRVGNGSRSGTIKSREIQRRGHWFFHSVTPIV